jgi:hypothetical protein
MIRSGFMAGTLAELYHVSRTASEAGKHFVKGIAIAHQQSASEWESRIHQSMELMEPTG